MLGLSGRLYRYKKAADVLSAASGKGHIMSWQRVDSTPFINYTTCKAIKLKLIKAIIS